MNTLSKEQRPKQRVPATKLCCACGATFEPHGNASRCTPCDRTYRRARRAARKAAGLPPLKRSNTTTEQQREYDRRYFASNPESLARRHARKQAQSAIRYGKLQRQPCEVCGAVEVDAHHDDYSRPLDVRWLCPRHHREHHNNERQRAAA